MNKNSILSNPGLIIGLVSGLIGGLIGVVAAFMAHWIVGIVILGVEFFVFRLLWKVLFQPILKQKRLMAEGIDADATILSLSETGSSLQIGGALPKAGVELVLEVSPSYMASYQASVRTYITVFEMQKFQPGSKIKIKYNPKNPQELIVVEGHAFTNFKTGIEINKEDAQKLLETVTETQKDLFERGIEKKAVIKSSKETGVVVNGDNPLVEMEVEVNPGGLEAYAAKVYAVVVRASLYKTAPGKEILVKTDPNNKEILTLFSLQDNSTVVNAESYPTDHLHHYTPSQFQHHNPSGKKRGCSIIFLSLIGIGILIGLWFLLRDVFIPNRIKGDFVDAVMVPGDNGQAVLFMITDGTFYYTSETETPGRHTIETKSLFDKLYIYIYDPVSEKVLFKEKISYDNAPNINKIKYINGRVWFIQDYYSNHDPEVSIRDAASGLELSGTEAFVSSFPQLSTGLSELLIYYPELSVDINFMDHTNYYYKTKLTGMQIKTKDGQQFDYFFDPDSLYDNANEYKKYWINNNSLREHWFVLDEQKAPRNELIMIEGSSRDFDAKTCSRKDTVEKYQSLLNRSNQRKFSKEELLAFQGLKMKALTPGQFYLEGFKIYEDNDYVIIVHQDQVGSGAKRQISCIKADGKICWTLDQEDFFEDMAIDPENPFSETFFIRDKIEGCRIGSTFGLNLQQVGFAGYDIETGKKLWEYIN